MDKVQRLSNIENYVNEEWKNIDYQNIKKNYYQISNYGRIKNNRYNVSHIIRGHRWKHISSQYNFDK